MSESETDSGNDVETGEHTGKRTGQLEACQRCGRKQGLVGKYNIWLCRQCFREIARGMGFEKYQ
ncbi:MULTISPECIES: 30S ribosomal protein S14 [Halococcus]|jgi:small subunit ribosomal protein S14|uniref:Small ribosomal subunit protein uS14 n=1 Tax=Halococcus hamelinensis 100A6 TaxID=1132509 RepID=M0LRP5_9EURY|nr:MULTISPECIES: 30S ribosomal protein S14 [Halococcus]EMA35773.1 30S ribosomal protein S14P [Halococcus hamelinensis 100A6]RJT02654.1 30S ribosomal protein S14 [Halococcus sp. IIIV-5B]